MGTTNPVFKGTSSYSTDFANVISRAVAIAQLPVTQLTNYKADLTGQSDELTKLDTKFTALQGAVQKIASALGGSSFQTSVTSNNVSTTNVVGISVADGAAEGVYSMNVTDVGAYETSMSAQNWNVANDVSGKPTTFTLVVGNQNYSVTPADNSARSVAAAINASYGNLVQATTVNVATGDTRISLKSLALGAVNLDFLQIPTTAPASLQSQATTGYAVSQTAAKWDASGSPAASYTLAVGGFQLDFTPDSNSADDVASKINAIDGGQVRASVVDLGTGASHDYRVSLQSTTDGPINGSMLLDLKKTGGASLQAQQLPALSLTTAAWNGSADAAGSRSAYTLLIGTTKYSFTPANNSAKSVADAINGLYGGQVHASVVDLQTGGNPDLRIALQAPAGTTLGIQKTTATHFQNEQTAGKLASYEVNNSGVINTSASRSIEISDGVTATLLGTSGGSPVDITVTRSTSALNTALSAFADAYNAAVDEVTGQRGQTGGALGGQAVVSQLSNTLSSICTYSSGGQFNVLENLGLKLETSGRFTYTAVTLIGAELTNSAGVAAFLGSATGGGFLKKATDALASLEAPVTGLLKTSQTDMKSQIGKLAATIADKQSKVDALQIRLQNQMAASDALIASMEQRYSYFSSLFSAQSTANGMYK